MKKSFIDRLFPHSSDPLLPQYEQTEPFARPSSKSSKSSMSPPRIRMLENVPSSIANNLKRMSPSLPSSNMSSSLGSSRSIPRLVQSTASVLHPDNPFLPIERAARALQDSIQSLLDAQSHALSGRTDGAEEDDALSGGSLTPTPSMSIPQSTLRRGTVPIRQPVKKKPSLRGARKGLSRKMQQFSELKKQELQIVRTEIQTRKDALERISNLETKKSACLSEIESIQQADTSSPAANLRAEAKNVESEIEELEHRLLELRVRHRHLNDQADQLDSAKESEISSFRATVAMVDRETRDFLRRPPVSSALRDNSTTQTTGMYALKADRRTLKMAREEWTTEQEMLSKRQTDVEKEYNALIEGERMWSEAIHEIDSFEHNLRLQTRNLTDHDGDDASGSINVVLDQLSQVIDSLDSSLTLAESKNYNLLVCAIGAELEAFHQAREMLEETHDVANGSHSTPSHNDVQTSEIQPNQAAGFGRAPSSPHGSVGSNQSLRATLAEFPHKTAAKYESEDDEPPPDFFLSH